MRGLQKSKRVSWASDLNLCQVKLFLSDESPSQVGLGGQDHMQAKAWHSGGAATNDNLPPGFEGTHPSNLFQNKLSQIHIAELSAMLRGDEEVKAPSEGEVGTSAPKKMKKKRKFVQTDIEDASRSATRSRTQSLQILSTPPQSPSPQTTILASTTTPIQEPPKPPSPTPQITIPTSITPISEPPKSPSPTPSAAPIPPVTTTTTTTTPIRVTTIPLRMPMFTFAASTSSSQPTDLAAELASQRAVLSALQDEMITLRAESRANRELVRLHADEFKRAIDDVRTMHAEEISALQDLHQQKLDLFKSILHEELNRFMVEFIQNMAAPGGSNEVCKTMPPPEKKDDEDDDPAPRREQRSSAVHSELARTQGESTPVAWEPLDAFLGIYL